MTKRLRECVEEEERREPLPKEIKDHILSFFVGSIHSLCNWHMTERYYAKKWRNLDYLKTLLVEQKSKILPLFFREKHGSLLGTYFDYCDMEISFQIISHLLENMLTLEVIQINKPNRWTTFWYKEKLEKFMCNKIPQIQTGTKTYPQSSSPLTAEQIYSLKIVEKYMKLCYGWTLGIRRDGVDYKLVNSDFSKVYLEHQLTLCILCK